MTIDFQNTSAVVSTWLQGQFSSVFLMRPRWYSHNELLDLWAEALSDRGGPGDARATQVYLHMPYCRTICRFCNYWSKRCRSDADLEAFTNHMIGEISAFRYKLGTVKAANAYFGGGTPSLLQADQLKLILGEIKQTFRISNMFTTEANPNTLTEEKIEILAKCGVNRISMGVQSLDKAVMKMSGRLGIPAENIGALVTKAKDEGIAVNLDLVLGLPGQNPDSFRSDLLTVAQLAPSTITIYPFIPNSTLAHPPGEEMTISKVMSRDLDEKLLDYGFYRGATRGRSGSDQDPSIAYTTDDNQTLSLPDYSLFDDLDTNIIGLGPGAHGHIFRKLWYRNLTGLAAIPREAIHAGTSMTDEDEARLRICRNWMNGKPATLATAGSRLDTDIEKLFESLPADSNPALHRVRSGLALDANLKNSDRWAALIALMPDIDSDPWVLFDTAEARGWDIESDIQNELILDGAWPSEADRSERLIQQWLELVKVSGVGDKLGSAEIIHAKHGEVHLQVLPPPAAALKLAIHKPDGTGCYGHSKRFAIAVCQRDDSLSQKEELYLRTILQWMQKTDRS